MIQIKVVPAAPYLLLTIFTAYFCPLFLCVQHLQMEKLPSPRTLSLRSIS